MFALMALDACFFVPAVPAQAQDRAPHEIGVVYYADGSGFKALMKEAAPQSGRYTYSAKVKGAHADVRLPAGQPQSFRLCGSDPTRYKLFTFQSTGKSRTVTLATVNVWIGGATSKLSESEVPVVIESADNGCFRITPKEALKDGEYGFSPFGAEDVFMFGVGEVAKHK
jgi:hypothetical protein